MGDMEAPLSSVAELSSFRDFCQDRGVEDLASAELAWAEAQATGLERDTVQVMVRDVVVVVVGQEDADLAATDLVEAVGLTAGDLVAMHQEDVGLAPTDPVVVADLVVAGLVVADPAVADPAVADPAVADLVVVGPAVVDLVVVGPAVVDLVVAVDLVVTVGLVLAVGLVQVVTVGLVVVDLVVAVGLVVVDLVVAVGLVVVDLVVAGQAGTGRREVLTSLLQAVLLMLAHPLEDIHTTVMKARLVCQVLVHVSDSSAVCRRLTLWWRWKLRWRRLWRRRLWRRSLWAVWRTWWVRRWRNGRHGRLWPGQSRASRQPTPQSLPVQCRESFCLFSGLGAAGRGNLPVKVITREALPAWQTGMQSGHVWQVPKVEVKQVERVVEAVSVAPGFWTGQHLYCPKVPNIEYEDRLVEVREAQILCPCLSSTNLALKCFRDWRDWACVHSRFSLQSLFLVTSSGSGDRQEGSGQPWQPRQSERVCPAATFPRSANSGPPFDR